MQNNFKPQPKLTIRQRIENRKNEDRKNKNLNFSSFLIDVKRNPMILIGLGGSAVFTSLAGLFIGVDPHRAGDTITFFGGSESVAAIVIGVTFGMIYATFFPVLGEWGVYYWHKKASLRDVGNNWQGAIAYTMLGLTSIFMTVTAIFASTILASLLGTFTQYATIPPAAQVWTVTIIPVGLALHAFANIWYDHKSKAAEERRELEHGLQTTEIEAESRIREAQVRAREKAAIAFAEEYERVSDTEAVSVGKARGQDAWKRDKVELGADRNNNGIPDFIEGKGEKIPEVIERNNGNHPQNPQ